MKYCALASKILKDIRVSNSYSQFDFANELGISRRQLLRYENGESSVSLEFFYSVLEYFNISFSDYSDDFKNLAINKRKLTQAYLHCEHFDLIAAEKTMHKIEFDALSKTDLFSFRILEKFIQYKKDGDDQALRDFVNTRLYLEKLKSAENFMALNMITMFLNTEQLLQTIQFMNKRIENNKSDYISSSKIYLKIVINSLGYLLDQNYTKKIIYEELVKVKKALALKPEHITMLPYVQFHLSRYFFLNGLVNKYSETRDYTKLLAKDLLSKSFYEKLCLTYEQLETNYPLS